jgi:hypothetical protein
LATDKRHIVAIEFGKGAPGELLQSKFQEVCEKMGKSLSEALRDIAMDYVMVYGSLDWDQAVLLNMTDRMVRGSKDLEKLAADAERARLHNHAQVQKVLIPNRRVSPAK